MKWKRIRFAKAFRVKHGFAFKSRYFDSEGPFVLLTPGSFNEQGGFRHQGDKTKYDTGDVPGNYLLNEGELLVAMTEQAPGLLGSSLWVPDSGRFLHNQRLGRIVDLDEEVLDRRFLYYLFNTRSVRHQIFGSASGTKVRHTAPERIGRVEADVPPVGAQRQIAFILSAYDDLIENNRRRIALLEESARLLYREWFVRLRFPGHEHTRIVNGVPVGWRKLTLGDICTDNREMVSPESLEPDTPYIGLEHMPRRSIALADWGTAEQVTSSKLRFNTGDILFGKIRPYFHKVGIAFTDAFVIRPTTENLKSFILMTVSSDDFVADTSQAMKEGSKMPRADWKQMIQFPVMVPPPGLLQDFSETIEAITDQLRNLCFQNQKLRTARDLLLPKLMSGEIEV
jgi:type I restriction enzyme S subunit